MKEMIKELYESDESVYNKEWVLKARKNKGKINQYLLDELNYILDLIDDDISCLPMFVSYAVFLLAEFKDTRLCPILLRMASIKNKEPLEFLGLVVADKLPNLIVSTFDGDFEAINAVIENKNLNLYNRGRVVSVYGYFYENNLISKDDLIVYLRKLIKLCDYEDDDIYSSIRDIVADYHIFEMIDDIKMLFEDNVVDERMRGGYDSFIDAIFTYDRDKERLKCIDDLESYLMWLYNLDAAKMRKKAEEYIKKDMEEHLIDYSKVGRNDLCPCGSGKKYKKCCIDRRENTLVYQKYITESLAEYPKKNDNKNEVDFYSFYEEECIEIDKLLYKALKRIFIPIGIERNYAVESDIHYEYLNQAFVLIKNIVDKYKFKTIEEYDKKVSIHYSLHDFVFKYGTCLFNKYYGSEYNIYLEEFEDFIKYFSNVLILSDEKEYILYEHITDYYKIIEKYKEGIDFFMDKLSKNKSCKYEIYDALFELYELEYDYDERIKKMNELIDKEDDEDLEEYLNDLLIDYIDDEKED